MESREMNKELEELNILDAIVSLIPLSLKVGGSYQKVNEELENQINLIKEQKKYYEDIYKKNEEKIQSLEKKLKENIEEIKRKEIEREKQLLEKEQKEKEKVFDRINKKEEETKNCKKYFSKEISQEMFKSLCEYVREEQNWLSTNGPKIENKKENLKQKLEKLFDELYENGKISEKINNKFIKILKSSVNKLELEKINFIVMGNHGVGKSTLINELFGENLVKENFEMNDIIGKKYESKFIPFLTMIEETFGYELGEYNNYSDYSEKKLEQTIRKFNSYNPNEYIHCIIYCITSVRLSHDELKLILKIRKKFGSAKLPVVIAYTRAKYFMESEQMKEAINEFLNKQNENINNDNFDIGFVEVNAREEIIRIFDGVYYIPCIGLSDLISICYKKVEKSYKISIKDIFVQNAKNKINEYINDISEQQINNSNFYYYLNQEFEPNFQNYIAYSFQKLSDIENMEGIGNNEKQSDKKKEEYNNIDKIINYMNILKVNLNLESRNSINNFITDFKKELIDEFNENYNKFINKASKDLYKIIFEIYSENNEELKSKAKLKLTALLKERFIEDCLKKYSSKMIQFIIQIFQTKLNNKIEEFINNIDKNKEAQNFFTTCDILNENKQLKINEKINTYIKALKKREEESGIKAFGFNNYGNKPNK